MGKTIDDSVKAVIRCDNKDCPDRGDIARCYLDIYRLCKEYPDKKQYDDKLEVK